MVLHAMGMPTYRVPVYAELARRPGIRLSVYYGEIPGLKNAMPDGFIGRISPVRVLCRRPLVMWQGGHLAAAERTAEGPDVVIMPSDLHYLSLLPAMWLARQAGIGVVLWGHGYSKWDNQVKRRLRIGAGHLADTLLLYHEVGAAAVRADGFAPERVFVAPNSIDQGPIQTARARVMAEPEQLRAFKAEHGLDDGPVLIFLSRLLPDRRLDLMFLAMQMLSERYPRLQAVVIGDGDQERERLRGLAAQAGVREVGRKGVDASAGGSPGAGPRVRFLPGMYREPELAPWFLSSDLMCFPAFIGLSLLHAYGYGLPIVTSDDKMMHGPEYAALRDEQNGKVFRAGSAQGLAGALDWVLRDRERLAKLSAEALRTAVEEHSIPRMVDGLEAAVRDASERVRARRIV